MQSIKPKIKTLTNHALVLLFSFSLLFSQFLFFLTKPVQAATRSWDFSSSSDYSFDSDKIEVSSGQAQVKATSGWYNSSWEKRKAITITGSTGGAQTNYQVKITLTYDSDMQADFDDIRFTDSDGTTLIDHYLESKTDSSTADFWVKIPSIPASPNTTIIYAYYSNTSASSSSNGDSTFLFFDDFEDGSLYHFIKSSNNPILNGIYPAMYKSGTDYWIYYDSGGTIYRRVCTTETNCGTASSTGISGQYAYVWNDSGTYRLLYTETGAGNLQHIRLATSSSGLNFTDQGRVLSIGSSGEWDDTYVHDPSEVKVGSTYYLYYAGRPETSSITSRIGLATSTTGSGTYTKQGEILQSSTSGWDNSGLFDPHIYEYGSGKYMLMYTGWDQTEQRWGYATSTDLTSGWSKSSDNPIMWSTQSWERANNIEPSCIIDESKWKCWYRGDSTDNEIGYLYFNQDPLTGLPLLNNKWITSGGTWSESGGILSQSDTVEASHRIYSSYSASDYLTEAKVKHTGLNANSELMARHSSGNFYSIGPEGVESNIYLAYHNPGFNNINNTALTTNFDVYYNYQLWVNGTSLFAKSWLSSNSEPVDWTLTGTHFTLTSGNTGFFSFGSSFEADWIRARKYVSLTPSSSIGSEQNLYPNDDPTISPTSTNSQTFVSLSGFLEIATKNGGEIRYQISNDAGTTWYWYNSGWTTTTSGYSETNTASVINANISSFPVGNEEFLFKAYLHSDGTQLVQLASVTLTYFADDTPPSISLTTLSPDPNTDNTPSITGVATDAAETVNNVQFQMNGTSESWSNCTADDGSFDDASEAFTCTTSTLTDGSHTIYVRATDSNGNTTAGRSEVTDTFTIDTATPTVSVTALSPDPISDSTPSITGTATDATTALTAIEYQVDSTSGSWASCTADDGAINETSEAFTCTSSALTDGSHTIYIRATDNATNTTTEADYGRDTFTIDITGPTNGNISINSGDSYTTSRSVTLTISATDATTNVSQMMISENSDFTGASWESCATSKSWTLTSGDGTKNVYVRFKDSAGNVSSTFSDSIILIEARGTPRTQVVDIETTPKKEEKEKEMEEEVEEVVAVEEEEEEEKEEKETQLYDVRIKVIDKKNKPIKDAHVYLFSDPREEVTDEEGIAFFEGVEAGEHKVVVKYGSKVGEETISLAQEGVKTFEITIKIEAVRSLIDYLIPCSLGLIALFLGILVVIQVKKRGKNSKSKV